MRDILDQLHICSCKPEFHLTDTVTGATLPVISPCCTLAQEANYSRTAPPAAFSLRARRERPLFPFQGKRISFYKRAQILVADSWGIMEARGEGNLVNMDWLTMFADYRVPQALVHLGVLRYSDALMRALKNGEGGSFSRPGNEQEASQAERCLLPLHHPQESCSAQATGERWRSEAAPFGPWS